jgi:flagellar biosynthesis protein FlhG
LRNHDVAQSRLGESSSLMEVSRITGIEPSRIRFMEREFPDLFGEKERSPLRSDHFDHRQVELLTRMNGLLFNEQCSVLEVRRMITSQLGGRNARFIAVTSGKGGVGKTTVSFHVAEAMAREGFRVLLVDADLGLGNVHVLANLRPKRTLLDVVEQRVELERAIVHGPSGLHVLCGVSGWSPLADLVREKIELLIREIVRISVLYDLVILDTSAGIATNVMTFLNVSDETILVVTPTVASTLDAYGVMKSMHDSKMGGHHHIVVNRAVDADSAVEVASRLQACAGRFLQKQPTMLGMIREDPVFGCNHNRRTAGLEPGREAQGMQDLHRVVEHLRTSIVPGRDTKPLDRVSMEALQEA